MGLLRPAAVEQMLSSSHVASFTPGQTILFKHESCLSGVYLHLHSNANEATPAHLNFQEAVSHFVVGGGAFDNQYRRRNVLSVGASSWVVVPVKIFAEAFIGELGGVAPAAGLVSCLMATMSELKSSELREALCDIPSTAARPICSACAEVSFSAMPAVGTTPAQKLKPRCTPTRGRSLRTLFEKYVFNLYQSSAVLSSLPFCSFLFVMTKATEEQKRDFLSVQCLRRGEVLQAHRSRAEKVYFLEAGCVDVGYFYNTRLRAEERGSTPRRSALTAAFEEKVTATNAQRCFNDAALQLHSEKTHFTATTASICAVYIACDLKKLHDSIRNLSSLLSSYIRDNAAFGSHENLSDSLEKEHHKEKEKRGVSSGCGSDVVSTSIKEKVCELRIAQLTRLQNTPAFAQRMRTLLVDKFMPVGDAPDGCGTTPLFIRFASHKYNLPEGGFDDFIDQLCTRLTPRVVLFPEVICSISSICDRAVFVVNGIFEENKEKHSAPAVLGLSTSCTGSKEEREGAKKEYPVHFSLGMSGAGSVAVNSPSLSMSTSMVGSPLTRWPYGVTPASQCVEVFEVSHSVIKTIVTEVCKTALSCRREKSRGTVMSDDFSTSESLSHSCSSFDEGSVGGEGVSPASGPLGKGIAVHRRATLANLPSPLARRKSSSPTRSLDSLLCSDAKTKVKAAKEKEKEKKTTLPTAPAVLPDLERSAQLYGPARSNFSGLAERQSSPVKLERWTPRVGLAASPRARVPSVNSLIAQQIGDLRGGGPRSLFEEARPASESDAEVDVSGTHLASLQRHQRISGIADSSCPLSPLSPNDPTSPETLLSVREAARIEGSREVEMQNRKLDALRSAYAPSSALQAVSAPPALRSVVPAVGSEKQIKPRKRRKSDQPLFCADTIETSLQQDAFAAVALDPLQHEYYSDLSEDEAGAMPKRAKKKKTRRAPPPLEGVVVPAALPSLKATTPLKTPPRRKEKEKKRKVTSSPEEEVRNVSLLVTPVYNGDKGISQWMSFPLSAGYTVNLLGDAALQQLLKQGSSGLLLSIPALAKRTTRQGLAAEGVWHVVDDMKRNVSLGKLKNGDTIIVELTTQTG